MLEPAKEWKAARQTKRMQQVFGVLSRMMGKRERCMYCLDSHGSDIEHFWPKTPYPQRMFVWRNLLLCCAECGRMKGDRFPLEQGIPLLVDPTAEDPWQHLDFDPKTGNLTARYLAELGRFSRKGEATAEVLQLDRREALAAGYLKTWRRLAEAVREYRAGGISSAARLAQELLNEDDHGLLGWCLHGAGVHESPFRELRQDDPEAWRRCAEAVRLPAP